MRQKKINYVSEKYQQELEELEMQNEEKWRLNAKERIIYEEETCKKANEREFKIINWICEFLIHFLETFQDIRNETARKINALIRIIKDNFAKNVLEIDEIVKNAKCDLETSTSKFYENDIHVERRQRKRWKEIEENFGKYFNQIFEEIDDEFKEKKWYKKLGKLKDVYIQFPDIRTILIRNTFQTTKWTPLPEGVHLLDGTVCFICEDKGHRIKFASNKVYCFENQQN